MDRDNILEGVRRALTADPRIHQTGADPIRTRMEGSDLLLEGVVADVASKKLALERAGAVPGVGMIVDRLRVEPAAAMSDGEILQKVLRVLDQESAFDDLVLRHQVEGGVRLDQTPPGPPRGAIEVTVEDGVVTLDGEVPSLSHKRLAGVLAWWIPGVMDVVNGLAVEPPQEDSDAEITDAIRLVLDKDPLVDASRIRVRSASSTVRLEGTVDTLAQREAAEFDAWCVFGVDGVENRLEIRM